MMSPTMRHQYIGKVTQIQKRSNRGSKNAKYSRFCDMLQRSLFRTQGSACPNFAKLPSVIYSPWLALGHSWLPYPWSCPFLGKLASNEWQMRKYKDLPPILCCGVSLMSHLNFRAPWQGWLSACCAFTITQLTSLHVQILSSNFLHTNIQLRVFCLGTTHIPSKEYIKPENATLNLGLQQSTHQKHLGTLLLLSPYILFFFFHFSILKAYFFAVFLKGIFS